jgi:hypothetical protein
MGHLTGARTKREITAVEIVSDDSLRVLKVTTTDSGAVVLNLRDAVDSEWSGAKQFAVLSREDAEIVATILQGGAMPIYGGSRSRIEALPETAHTLPKAEAETKAEPDCTPLDIERARAANLAEERANIVLTFERDHSRGLHNPDVPGCPACERRIRPGHGDGSRRETCARCGSPLDEKGLCTDETCPYSDRPQGASFTED